MQVYIPADEHLPGERGLLILFDGQNVFDDHGSFAGGWYAHRAVDRLQTKKRRAPVIVAIDHGHADRIHELSPFVAGPSQGRLDVLLSWVVGHLVPSLRSKFSIKNHPSGIVVGGSSMGGLAALYAHFRHPATFGGALSMSPSLWLGGRKIFEFVGAQSNPWTTRVYLDCGAREGRNGGMLTLAASMADHLRGRGYNDAMLRWRPDARGQHNEKCWRRRLPGALRFFFA